MTAAGLVASGGLAIYDGIGWLVFNNSNSPIPINKVISVLKSNTSALWAGTNGGGLVKKDGLEQLGKFEEEIIVI